MVDKDKKQAELIADADFLDLLREAIKKANCVGNSYVDNRILEAIRPLFQQAYEHGLIDGARQERDKLIKLKEDNNEGNIG